MDDHDSYPELNALDMAEVPMNDYRAYMEAAGTMARDMQAVTAKSIRTKMLIDYPIAANMPIENAMMNLLFEADIVLRTTDPMIGPNGIFSQDRSAKLVIEPTGTYVGLSMYIDGESGRHEVSYINGALEADVKNDAEREILGISNKILLDNARRQVVEIGESFDYLKANKPGFISLIRSEALLAREKIVGYSGEINGSNLHSLPQTIDLNENGDIHILLTTTLSRDKKTFSNQGYLNVSKINNNLDDKLSVSYVNTELDPKFGNEDLSESYALRSLDDFFSKPNSIQHYTDFAKSRLPAIERDNFKEMLKNIPMAKKLAVNLSNQVELMENNHKQVLTSVRGR